MNKEIVMTPAIRLLKQIGTQFTVHTYTCDVTDDFGKHCAKQLHMDENRVFKTLLLQHEKVAITAIIPVNTRLNLKSSAKALHFKQLSMMLPTDAERITGYKVGGISPFAQKKTLPTLLDERALNYASIVVSGGKRGVSVELSPQDFITLLNATVADIGE
jgi:Cys-tRNA(Pro)/Cys-tRNA(Cys) deacylase